MIRLFRPYVSEKAIELASQALRSGWIGEGPRVKEFEAEISKKFRLPYVLSLITGTAALHLALEIAGASSGDEVISTAQTCTATNQAILQVGAKPVFADVQYETGNIDPSDINHRVTPKTRAIMVVHWGGYPPDLDEINEIAARHGISVIEDACQALGATYRGQSVGCHSRFVCFSLQAIKVLTGVEGGILSCRNCADYGMAQLRHWYSIDKFSRKPNTDGYYDHDILYPGFKYNYNDVFASIALGNLIDFDERMQKRQQRAELYRRELTHVPGIQLFKKHKDRQGTNYLFSMHVDRRGDFIRMMKERDIECGIVHDRNDKYTVFGGRRDDLHNLDRYERTHVSIPIHDNLTREDVESIIAAIKEGW